MEDLLESDLESDVDEELEWDDLDSSILAEQLAKIASKEDDSEEWLPRRKIKAIPKGKRNYIICLPVG